MQELEPGTVSGLHPVHCRLAQCRSIFVDRHRSNSLVISVSSRSPLTLAVIIKVGCCSVCWIWSVPTHTGASATSHTTAGLD